MATQELKKVKIYDTLSRKKNIIEPIKPGEISLYVCGVTVYDLTHIGHARTFVFFDIVQRFLRHLGYKVKFVRNHTDVDDKIILRAQEKGVDPLELSQHFIEELDLDMGALGVEHADVEPKVSEHIEEIIGMVKTLVEKGYGYEAGGDVYYRVKNFQGYGKLSGRKLEDMEAGRSGRVDGDEVSLKEHPFDFALWKNSKEGDPAWDSPWGQGRPGWHIECSAMSCTHLGEKFDIHGGGQDLTFPHHENEIAQTEATTGVAPMAKTWMHVAMLNVDGEKMSKSKFNFWTTRDVLKSYHSESIRLFMHTTHYRNPINYSTDTLNEATRRMVYFYNALVRIDETLERGGYKAGDTAPDASFSEGKKDAIEAFYKLFDDALADDFNTSMAVTLIHEMAKFANDLTASKKKPKPDVIKTLLALRTRLLAGGKVLGILQSDPQDALIKLRDLAAVTLELDKAKIENLIIARKQARADKNWAEADKIRDELLAMRVEIMDSPKGTTWRIRYEFNQDD